MHAPRRVFFPPLSVDPRFAKRQRTLLLSPRRIGGGTRGACDEQGGTLIRSISHTDAPANPQVAPLRRKAPRPPSQAGGTGRRSSVAAQTVDSGCVGESVKEPRPISASAQCVSMTHPVASARTPVSDMTSGNTNAIRIAIVLTPGPTDPRGSPIV